MAPASAATNIKSAAKNVTAALTGKQTAQAKPGKTDAASLLKADHRKVEQLFAQFEQTQEDGQKQQLVQQICKELIIHTKLEEEIFYPACREKDVDDELMDEAQVEHDGAKVLIGDLLECEPDDDYYDAKVKTLSEYIRHHVGEEEKPRSGIFAKAQKAGVDMAALGEKIQTRKTELMEQGEAIMSRPPQPRSFTLNPQGTSQESNSMARYSNERDRDERGRFTDEDDNGGRGRSGGYQSRGQNRERDDQGRFMSDDDDRGYSSRGGSGRGHGGWYGDSQGHSQAAREGWDERGSSRSSRGGGYDDDRGYSSHGQGNYRERDDQGRFMSDDDDNRGSRGRQSRGRDDDDNYRSSGRGHGGWYGDPQGHSQAAREGWEERGYSGRQSRSNRDDDDRRSSRSSHGGGHGGHGGWFGDPEGHSEASREGWRNR